LKREKTSPSSAVAVAPDSASRIESTPIARDARSPAARERKKPGGSESSRSHTAACTAAPAFPSMRVSATARVSWKSAAATATASSTAVSCASCARSAPGITELKRSPVATGGAIASAPPAHPTSRSVATSRPHPRTPKRSSPAIPTGPGSNGR